MNGSRLLGIGSLLVAGLWLYLARQYTFWVRIFPQVMSYVLLVIGVLLLLLSFRSKRGPNPWSGADPWAVIATVFTMVLYVVSLDAVGFVLGSVLMFSILGFYLGPRGNVLRRIGITLAFSIGLSVALYAMFVYLFNVPLPRGAWI